MKISVTQEHIDNGYRGSVVGCPLALAIRDCVPDNVFITVVCKAVYIAHRRIKLPLACITFVCDYDAKKKVFPFEFELDI